MEKLKHAQSFAAMYKDIPEMRNLLLSLRSEQIKLLGASTFLRMLGYYIDVLTHRIDANPNELRIVSLFSSFCLIK